MKPEEELFEKWFETEYKPQGNRDLFYFSYESFKEAALAALAIGRKQGEAEGFARGIEESADVTRTLQNTYCSTEYCADIYVAILRLKEKV